MSRINSKKQKRIDAKKRQEKRLKKELTYQEIEYVVSERPVDGYTTRKKIKKRIKRNKKIKIIF